MSAVGWRGCLIAAVLLLGSCALERPPVGPALSPEEARAQIDQAVPRGLSDRRGWINDLYAAFSDQGLVPTRDNVCAVVAVIEQESNFQVNPVVPGLGAIAWREIDTRAEHADVPRLIVHSALALRSPDGRTYSARIDAARTEKDLSDIYEDIIGSVPFGRRLFADWNPVRTRGPMQVNVAFAQQYAAVRTYPYPIQGSIADELFTRRGSVYFGVAHLLAYQPPYDDFLFRFADFNAGQYASRNAAFQNVVSRASGLPVVADGSLLPPAGSTDDPGETERALRTLASRLNVDQGEIHEALKQGKGPELERSRVYQRTFELAQRRVGHSLPRAQVPTISLHGPKLTRSLTTSWYAHRVDGRFKSCVGR